MYSHFLLNRQFVKKIKHTTTLLLVAALMFTSTPAAIIFAESENTGTVTEEEVQEQSAEPVSVEDETDISVQTDQEGQNTSEQEAETYTVIATADAEASSDVENTVNTNISNVETIGAAEGSEENNEANNDTDTANDGNGACTDCSVSTVNATSTFNESTSSNESDEFFGESEYSTTTVSETENGSATTTSETSEEYQNSTTASSTSSTSTSEVTSENVSGETALDTGTTGIEATNEAEAENVVEVGVQTGDNEASENENSLIVTGDAHASADVINMVNTNIINSEGFVMLLDSFSGSMDMRDLAYWDLLNEDADEVSDNACDLGGCDAASLLVSSDNNAEIINNITVSASTGGNTADDGLNAGIVTGNAYASANVVNLANTNIVDTNYLLITANNFGSVNGDIIFPSAGELSKLFFSGSYPVSSIAVANDNGAVIENNVEVNADTGGNEANNCQGSFVMTGDASSGANIVNQVNQNFTNADNFFLLLRVHGNWTGSVYGAPEELTWTETPNGIAVYNNPLWGSSALTGSNGPLLVQNSNTAAITNNVSVYALTGENHANNNENAAIVTGEAQASANIINIANTNVIGQNWMIAVVNIFGDWNGNISFGQPDLWIGGQVDTEGRSRVRVNNKVIYHYTIVNNSDTIATDVRVIDHPAKHMFFVGSQSGAVLDGRNVVWEIGDLAAGESAEVEYTARVYGSLPVANTLLENTVTVTSEGTDANMEDNTDVMSIMGYRRPPYLSSWPDEPVLASTTPELTPDPILFVSKTNSATTTLFAGVTVDYTIVVRNEGGEAYNAVLFDTLKGGGGATVYEQYWPLETVYPNEEITIEYSIVYDKYTDPGLYTNYAYIEAIAGDPSLDPIIGTFVSSSVATSSVNIATSTPPVSGFEIGLAVPFNTITKGGNETENSGVTLELDKDKTPVIIRKTTNIGYKLHSLIGGDMFTPVPVFLEEDQEEDDPVIVSAFHILNRLGGFAFMGSSAVRFSSTDSSGNNTDPASGSSHAPYGQFASIFDSLVSNWALPYFWAFILVLLGFALILLMRTRTNIVH